MKQKIKKLLNGGSCFLSVVFLIRLTDSDKSGFMKEMKMQYKILPCADDDAQYIEE